MDDRDDHELLEATATEPEAFGIFYGRHATAVLGYLRRRTGDVETAADLTAETFATALVAAERFDPARGPARAWLFGIANHVLSAHRRRGHAERRARRRLGISELGFVPDELARADEMLDARLGGSLAALVADLPTDQREAVLARVVQEREYDEIADATQTTPAAGRRAPAREPRPAPPVPAHPKGGVMTEVLDRIEEELVAAARRRATAPMHARRRARASRGRP